MNAKTLFNQSREQHRQGNYEQAADGYQRLLDADPDNAQTCYYLALLYFELGLLDAAAELFSRTVQLAPAVASAHYNLGVIAYEQENYQEAARCYEEAARLNPGDGDVFFNLALTRKSMGAFEAALDAYTEALRLNPDDQDVLYNIGVLYKDMGRYDAAIKAFNEVLQRNGDHGPAVNNLAYLYHRQGEEAKAITAYRRLIELDHHADMACHMLAALTGETTSWAPAAYVKKVFDDFSDNFDEKLVDKLGYATPSHLRRLVEATEAPQFACGLDIGCGTGLSGEALAELCDEFVGLDLSAKMLEQAAEKNLYDSLHESDIASFLAKTPHTYDLFVAADVFVYIGDLSEIFQLVSKRATEGAVFAFSTERAAENFRLKPTGRYGHSRSYISRLAAENDFELLQVEEATIRKEKDQWIKGNLYLLQAA